MTRVAARRNPLSYLLGMLAAIALLCGSEPPSFADDPAPAASIALRIEPPFAWNRTDQYVPPDFAGFFPDDAEAGQQLDDWLDGKLQLEGVDERLALIRRGLRRTTRHRTTLLGSVGNQFVWNRDVQDPRAIELLYHASASPDHEIAHYALYHGPTVVAERTPNLVRALMEQYQALDKQMQDRIAWGMKTYGDKERTRQLLLDLLNDHESLGDSVVASALDTHQAVFDAPAPNLERFADVGQWVIAFHRTDLSASHPRAAQILRAELDHVSLRNANLQLIDFVTRVDDGHETAVALVQGLHSRNALAGYLSNHIYQRIEFNELLSPRTLQERRLREFARHLPDGPPPQALPAYTRPPADAQYAYSASEIVPPNFAAFFADDPQAGAELDRVYADHERIELSDRELLELFRCGLRHSTQQPNLLFGWISSALGWPTDPLLTEILYQALDPQAPPKVREAGIYYGFGLGTTKTRNVLEAMFRAYMAPPFDPKGRGEMRYRILWGLGVHEDDKHYLASRFADALRDHESLSDEALIQAHLAYRQLTETDPPNAADYGSRGVFLAGYGASHARTLDEALQQAQQRFDHADHVLKIEAYEDRGHYSVLIALRGLAGRDWFIAEAKQPPQPSVQFLEHLTPELIDEAKLGALDEFKALLPAAPNPEPQP